MYVRPAGSAHRISVRSAEKIANYVDVILASAHQRIWRIYANNCSAVQIKIEPLIEAGVQKIFALLLVKQS